jgi:hypothetical protein
MREDRRNAINRAAGGSPRVFERTLHGAVSVPAQRFVLGMLRQMVVCIKQFFALRRRIHNARRNSGVGSGHCISAAVFNGLSLG